jgi:uncharacterized protein
MNIMADIAKIKELAKKKEDENWEFRAWLKGGHISGRRIDAAVHELNYRISELIDCRECANCCKTCTPILKMLDMRRLAEHLNLKLNVFQRQYLAACKEEEGYSFRETPCPFLHKNLCSVYDQRPNDCRSYPHLYKKDFTFRLLETVTNCSICPIVFNVYEELKARFWRKRRDQC